MGLDRGRWTDPVPVLKLQDVNHRCEWIKIEFERPMFQCFNGQLGNFVNKILRYSTALAFRRGIETSFGYGSGKPKSIGYWTPVYMVTPSHFDLPEGGGCQTRQHLKDQCCNISVSNSETGQKKILDSRLLWHSWHWKIFWIREAKKYWIWTGLDPH